MISRRVLVAIEDFDGLDAARAATAVGRGLSAGGGARDTGADGAPGGAASAGGAPDGTTRDGGAGSGAIGALEVDLCPLERSDGSEARDPAAIAARLAAVDFDARMRAARAVVVVAARLDEATLLGSATFEIATRARQAGVPAYAVAATNALSPFDARMLDLQVILQARDARALRRAGEKLAAIV